MSHSPVKIPFASLRWRLRPCKHIVTEMTISLKRVYDAPAAEDGYRVLVDRLWPRGFTKERAQLDEWAKEIAPSNELRKWIHADMSKWAEFRKKYFKELAAHDAELRGLLKRSRHGRVTLLYAAADSQRNHALVLAEYLQSLG